MARNLARSGSSKVSDRQQPDAIPHGLLIVLLGVMAWVAAVLPGLAVWHFVVAALS